MVFDIVTSSIHHTLYWSRTKYSASISVCDKHCSTAFIKHVFPWFCKPITPGTRSGGHACRFNGGTRPFVFVVFVVVVVVCLAYNVKRGKKKERVRKKMQGNWANFIWQTTKNLVHYLFRSFLSMFCSFSFVRISKKNWFLLSTKLA